MASINVPVNIDVDIDVELDGFDTDDLISEMKSRGRYPLEPIREICNDLQRAFEKQDRSEFDYFLNKIREIEHDA